MRAVLYKLAIVASLVLGLVQLSAIAHAHEVAKSLSQPAAGALATVAPACMSNCPGLSQPDRPADAQVYCSGVFLAGETVAIRLPATVTSRQQRPADSDIAAVAPSPDPPPPRL